MNDDATGNSSPAKKGHDSPAQKGHDSPAQKGHDVILLHSRTEDGQGLRALRSRPSRLELTELRPVKEGKPLMSGEVVRLRPRKESPLLCDVDVHYSSEGDSDAATGVHGGGDHDGPARVVSQAYRQNWDTIFRKPRRRKPTVLN